MKHNCFFVKEFVHGGSHDIPVIAVEVVVVVAASRQILFSARKDIKQIGHAEIPSDSTPS